MNYKEMVDCIMGSISSVEQFAKVSCWSDNYLIRIKTVDGSIFVLRLRKLRKKSKI